MVHRTNNHRMFYDDTYVVFVKLKKYGSIRKMTVTTPSVAIIGGGIAGCAAAWTLKQSVGDIDVKILEAENRLGGRIFSTNLSSSSPSDPMVELGANWIHGSEGNPLYDFGVESGLLIPAKTVEGRQISVSANGVVTSAALEEKVERVMIELESARCAFYAEGGGGCYGGANDGGINSSSSGGAGNCSGGVGGGSTSIVDHLVDDDSLKFTIDYQKRHLLEKARDEVERSFLERLCRNANMMEAEIWGSDSLSQVSLANYGSFRECAGKDIVLKNGFSSVVEYLVDPSRNEVEVVLNAVVDSVTWDDDEEESVDGGNETDDASSFLVKIGLRNGREIRADFVIVTASVGCLKDESIRFHPPLPRWKLDAIRRIGFGTIDKIILHLDASQASALKEAIGDDVFGVRFLWDDDVDAENVEETWIRGIGSFYFVEEDVINIWLRGVEARYFESLDDEAVLEAVDRVFRRFLNVSVDGAFHRRPPRQLLRTSWWDNEFFRGSYSFPARGSSIDDHVALGEPLGASSFSSSRFSSSRSSFSSLSNSSSPSSSNGTLRLMFAGEATHPYFYSTTHGAFESGIREAQRLQLFLRGR